MKARLHRVWKVGQRPPESFRRGFVQHERPENVAGGRDDVLAAVELVGDRSVRDGAVQIECQSARPLVASSATRSLEGPPANSTYRRC